MVYIRKSRLKHYKILTSNDNESFLIDLEGNIMNTIFPALLWGYSQKAYKISNEQAFALESRKKRIEASPLLIIGTVSMSLSLRKFTLPIIDKLTFVTSFQFSLIILLLSFMVCIFIKLYSYNRNKKRLSNIVNLNEGRPVRIKLLKEKRCIKNNIKLVCFVIFLLLMIFLTSYSYLEINNLFMLMSVVFFTYLYLFSNTTILPPTNIKDIKIIELREE